jgi:hypothetical protein
VIYHRSMRGIAGHRGAVLALLVAGAVVYAPLLSFSQAPFSPHSDIPAFHLGLKALWPSGADTAPPLWRADQGLGGPALTQPQTLFLHPLHAMFRWLAPERAFGVTLWFTLVFGAVGAYLLGMALGCSRQAALLAGVAELASVKWILACYAGWSSPLAVLAALPWVAAAMVHFVRAPALRSSLLLAAAWTVALAGGAPQTHYYLLLLLGGLAWFGGDDARISGAQGARRLVGIAVAGVLACGCMAYLWLPIVLDLPRLARAEQSYEFFLSGHALAPRHLLTLLYPEALGTPRLGTYAQIELWEDCAYVGLVPLLGVLVCASRWRKLRVVERYVLVAFGVSVMLSFDTPLLRVLYEFLPGYSVFRMPARMLFVSSVLAAALLACAVDGLRDRVPRALVAYAALAALMILEGALYARAYLTTVPAAQLLPDTDHPLRGLGADEHTRVAVVSRGTLNYGWAAPLGIELVNGYDPYVFASTKTYMHLVEHGQRSPQRMSNWIDLRNPKRLDLLRNLAVRHVVSPSALVSPELGPARRFDDVRNFTFYKGMRRTPLYVQELRETLPRVRFAGRVVVLPTERDVIDALLAKPVAGEAMIVGDEARAGHTGAPDPADRIALRSRSAGAVTLSTHTVGGRLLVLAEAWHPGWQASIDGRPERPLPVNLATMGVWLPRGTHDVRVWFTPPGLRAGTTVSLGALSLLLALAALAAIRGIRDRRRRESP